MPIKLFGHGKRTCVVRPRWGGTLVTMVAPFPLVRNGCHHTTHCRMKGLGWHNKVLGQKEGGGCQSVGQKSNKTMGVAQDRRMQCNKTPFFFFDAPNVSRAKPWMDGCRLHFREGHHRPRGRASLIPPPSTAKVSLLLDFGRHKRGLSCRHRKEKKKKTGLSPLPIVAFLCSFLSQL